MRTVAVSFVSVLVAAALAGAQEKPAGGFKNTLSLGATMTDGNSETLQVNASLVSEGEKPGLGSIRMGIEANYGESTINSNKDTTVKNAKAFLNVKKTFSPKTFGSLDASCLRDEIASINYRITVGPGLGAYFVKTEKAALSVEVGPTYVWEEVEVGGTNVTDNYFAIRFFEMASWAFSTGSKAWQSAEYLPKASDFNDYLLNAEIGVEAPLSAGVNLRLVLQDKYDSTPADDKVPNDLALVAGVNISL